MAEKIQTLNLPTEVIDSQWEDDIDVDYATYGDEKQEREYISPKSIKKESIEKIKSLKQTYKKRGRLALFGKL